MTDEERLSDLLLQWEESLEGGEDIPAERLCQDRPDLVVELAARILALKKVAWMKAPAGHPEDGASSWPSRPGDCQSRADWAGLPTVLAGRYRLDSLIAEGGFGRVWRGFDTELQRPVAVKLPKRSCLADGEQGFLSEARKVARLKHPAIVPVYDVGRHGSSYFIVSELIDGEDLSERMRRGRLPVREAVRIVAAVAYALEYAHNRDIIHRDIKPANVLLGADGQVYLTDFGIALDRKGMTGEAGETCGTLAYMSPEQAGGDPGSIGARSDIYSLGVMLCELVTGVRPAPASNTVRLRGSRPAGPLPPGVALPSFLSEVWRKCLARDPADRYATAKELAEHLRKAVAVVLEDEEWAACADPLRMLRRVHECASPRKMRLFVCGCVRQNFPLLEDPRSRLAVEVAERHADGAATNGELAAAHAVAWEARQEAWETRRDRQGLHQAHAAAWATNRDVWTATFNVSRHTEAGVQCGLLRELFGPSVYRPVAVHPAWVSWNDSTVRSLAQSIYDDRAFDRLAVLADALEEAGCEDIALLEHCRQPGPHVRGCWVVDLLLGKA